MLVRFLADAATAGGMDAARAVWVSTVPADAATVCDAAVVMIQCISWDGAGEPLRPTT